MDNPEGVTEDDSGLWDYQHDADIVMGHEFVGEVIGYGPGTERRFPLGTRVTSLPVLVRNGVYRIIGCSPEAPGGFGELMLVQEAMAQAVPPEVDDDHAALADAFSIGEYYVRRSGADANATPKVIPIVVGAGAIGLSAVAALHRRGVGPIIVSDYNADRLAVARALGASLTVDPREQSPFDLWRDIALDGKAIEMFADRSGDEPPACYVYEFVGLPGALDEIVLGTAQHTQIFSAGGPPQGDHISSMVAKRKGISIHFGGGPQPEDWYGMLTTICEGGFDPSPVIGKIVDLEGVPAAIDLARRADGPPRIMIHPHGTQP
jgi:threonine dehydrogenase-like Zn-dependent dehydrogenase